MSEKETTPPGQITPAAAVTGLTEMPPPSPPAPAEDRPGRTLRLWPGLAVLALMWPMITIPSRVEADIQVQLITMFWGPTLCGVLMCLWYAFFSRRPWGEALGIPFAFAALGAASILITHPTFKVFGQLVYAMPLVLTAWVAWLFVTGWMPWPARRSGLLAVFLVGWGACGLVRMDGIWGDFGIQLSWRWTETAEEKYHKSLTGTGAVKTPKEVVRSGPADWIGFRGANRDGVLKGFKVGTDWGQDGPTLLWKQRIGPGWGSFTVIGDRAFTQEQRGENEEAVVCLDANSGKTLWVHADPVRFTEPVAGPGPRATPTFHDGRLYTLGAKGLLNCLDPSTGQVLWSKDIAHDSGAKLPEWGFAASPTVAHGLVTVYAGGKGGKAVLAYDAKSGGLKWAAGAGLHGYASTQRMTLCGEEALAVTSGYGLTLLDPKSGSVRLEYEWKMAEGMARCCQPMAVGPDEVVFGTGFGQGTRKLKLTPSPDGKLAAEEVWTTKRLNPYYNDHVVHQGHLYGIDGIFLACIDLASGEQKWRTRGYDAGQVLLLADQGLLLVVSEKGKVALVKASPEKHERLAQIDAIEGKTWNHPAIAGGRLFVRNGEWAAAFKLPGGK